MEEVKNVRSIGIDIIKAMAVLFVLCVHFSAKTNYYDTPISGTNMFIQSILRWLFYSGVPLFIMCTGYLNYKKTISTSYYMKIFRVLVTYVLISIICIIVRIVAVAAPISFKQGVFSIFSFSAISYSWYVNMYIGLFLLAPILNVVINTIDQRKLLIIISTLIFIITFPATFNPLFCSIPRLTYMFFPDWWKGFYPILYYFIGAYVAKYRVEIKKYICALTVAFLLCLQTGLQMFLNRYQFNNWALSDYSSLFVLAESLGLFLMLYSCDVKSGFIRQTVKWVSTLTLEIYLFSYVTDGFIYPYFENHYYGAEHQMSQEMIFDKYFLITVPLTFISSALLASVFHILYEGCRKGIKHLMQKNKILSSSGIKKA